MLDQLPVSAEADRERYAAIGRALADPKRLCVLESLAIGELSVSDLSSRVGCQVPNMSQHLAVLRNVGLVTSRREGNTILLSPRRPTGPRGLPTHPDDRPLGRQASPRSGRKDPGPMAEIRVVTDATFEEMVLKNERPVVVDFWAAWCGPCKMVAPEMEKIAAKYDGQVDVVKVDVDANPGLSRAFNIMSIPTIAFFKPGAQPQGVVGFRPMEQLEQQFGLAEFSTPRVAEPAAVAVEASVAQSKGTDPQN